MAAMLYPIAPLPQHPDKVAFKIAETGEAVTFGKLEQRTNQAAQLFRACDVNAGDHIVLLSENRREFLEICFAADRAGIYYTAISTHATANEAAYITAHCDAKLLIVSEAKAAHSGGVATSYWPASMSVGMSLLTGSFSSGAASPAPQ